MNGQTFDRDEVIVCMLIARPKSGEQVGASLGELSYARFNTRLP